MKLAIIRRPIFNRYMEVDAYEIIFRSGTSEYLGCTIADPVAESICSEVSTSFSLERLSNNKRIFVSFDNRLLQNEIALKLPRNLITVELMERLPPVERLLEICSHLKEEGYLIACNELIFIPAYEPVQKLIDVIRIDFLAVSGQMRREMSEKGKLLHGKIMAYNVESVADFNETIQLGYDYVQGRFFTKPQIVAGSDINVSRGNYLRILSELTQPNIDLDRLAEVIQHDVAFSYKLMKFVNSAAFGFKTAIRSIKQALILLGKQEVMHWVSSLTLREAAHNKPQEVLSLSVTRAKFGELLAIQVGLTSRSNDLFLMGIFSLIDVLLDRALADILNELPLASDVTAALLGEKNQLKDLLELVLAYEKGDWAKVTAISAELNVLEEEIPKLYVKATSWADDFSRI